MEIGGKFRIPDKSGSQSGTMEVGTTTGLIGGFLRKMVTENTAIFWCTSSYPITGFAGEAEFTELAAAHNRGIPFWWILEAEALWILPFMESSLKKTVWSF